MELEIGETQSQNGVESINITIVVYPTKVCYIAYQCDDSVLEEEAIAYDSIHVERLVDGSVRKVVIKRDTMIGDTMIVVLEVGTNLKVGGKYREIKEIRVIYFYP